MVCENSVAVAYRQIRLEVSSLAYLNERDSCTAGYKETVFSEISYICCAWVFFCGSSKLFCKKLDAVMRKKREKILF